MVSFSTARWVMDGQKDFGDWIYGHRGDIQVIGE